MMSPEQQDIVRRLHQMVPQYVKLLENKLQEELNDLPRMSMDKVQISQGRALLLQELLAEVAAVTGNTANRTAKPNFSTP